MIFFPMGWLFDFQGDKHDTNIVSLTNHLNFTALALEICWNELKDFVYQKERKHQHLGKSLKQNTWWKKTLNQQTPELKFLLFL